jgi:hypothetical protein
MVAVTTIKDERKRFFEDIETRRNVVIRYEKLSDRETEGRIDEDRNVEQAC